MDVRPCQPGDYPAIRDIHNFYIEHTVVNFEEAPLALDEIEARVISCTGSYPWLVGVEDNAVIGYAYANRWQTRSAYRLSVETTIYLAPGSGGRGYGGILYANLLDCLRQQGLHTAVAGIALPNAASVALHERSGFSKVAHFAEVGWKLGRWVDVGYWQIRLAPGDDNDGRVGPTCP